jgi:hypothetical protein
MLTSKDDYSGYTIPIQTLLANFNENEEITLSTTEKKASELIDKGNDLFNSKGWAYKWLQRFNEGLNGLESRHRSGSKR